jgi:hypothetical protein
MGAYEVQAKIKAGLAKAKAKVGAEASPVVYLVSTTKSGGSSPLDPPVISTVNIELVNAVFNAVDKSMIDGSLVRAGDFTLVCDSDSEIKTGDTITQGSKTFEVITVKESNPFGVRLASFPVVRLK